MKPTARKTFTIRQGIHLSEGPDRSAAFRWINLQHAGKELIPLTESVSNAHRDAAYALVRGRVVDLTFETDKDGNWKLLKAKLV